MENQHTPESNAFNLSPAAAKWAEEQAVKEQANKEQRELINKGLSGQGGISAEMFKELYDNGTLKEKIAAHGFNKHNSGLVVELAITDFQKKQLEAQTTQAAQPAAIVPPKEIVADIGQQAATGGQFGASAQSGKRMDEVVDRNNIDYERLDKVDKNFKLTHSVVSSWHKNK